MAITNFDEYTQDLTDDEKRLSKIVLDQLKLRYNSAANPIKQDEIVKRMKGKGYNINGPRLRKIFNFLRSNGNPIIATSNGCHFSNDRKEIEAQIESLQDRQRALDGPIKGLIKCIKS